MAELESQLKATEATTDLDACLDWHTKIMTQLFAIYFRILKKGRDSPLLSSTLAGLSNFAHLINLDFFDDLLTNLHTIVATHKGLTFENNLHCVHTTFAILSGQGSALNIDPMRFYGQLYKDLMFEITDILEDKSVIIPLFLKCVHKMIVARSKQVSMSRLLAFSKRLATLALQQDSASAISILSSMRRLLLTSPKTEILYENEGTGSGVYLPEMDDPEYCKPEATALWDLNILRRHYHPMAATIAKKVMEHHPLHSEHKLSPEISLKDPAELYQLYCDHISDHQDYELGRNDFRPALLPMPQHKIDSSLKKSKSGKNAIFRVHRFANEQFAKYAYDVMDKVDVDQPDIETDMEIDNILSPPCAIRISS